MPRTAFRNFTGGEVTPTLSARYDLQKFGTFSQALENFVPNLHGDIERRPGTRVLTEISGDCVMRPFQYNSDPSNNFLLCFMSGSIYVYTINGTAIWRLDNPYPVDTVPEVSMAQAGRYLYMAHKNYPLKKITWDGTNWAISDVVLNNSGPGTPGAPWCSWHRGPKSSDEGETAPYTKNETYWFSYVITALDADGTESVASAAGGATGRYPTDWVQGDYMTVAWNAVAGAVEYNIYRDSAGYYGFVGTTTGTTFQDNNYEPDTATTPKKNWNPFAYGNYPATVCFHQQRLVVAGTRNEPATVYMSRTGDWENFRKSTPMQDDDPVEYMLASGSIDDIKWVDSFGDLLIGTSGAEYKMSAGDAAITPSDCQISTQSYWGSAGIQPIIIGTSVIHCQRADNHIRDLYYSWEQDGYSGNDLSLLAPQLLETHKVRQMVFQQSPGSNVWIVRDDGVLLCLTYMQEQKVYGWSRHTSEGAIRSICTLCGTHEDVLFLVVRRTVNGQTKYFLERMAERFKDTDPIADAWYVDCGTVVTPAADETGAKRIITGLTWLEGVTVAVLADGAPEEHKVTNGRIELTFPADKAIVGRKYTSVLSPLPIESDGQLGSTIGKRRAYGKLVLRLYRTVGGSWAGTRSGDLFDVDSWKTRTFYDIPFLPAKYGEAVQPFSGDIEISMGQESFQDNDSSVWIKQDRPQPFRLVAITADVDFGEM